MRIEQNSYVVTTTIDEQKHVLQKLTELGFIWAGGQRPIELIPLEYGKEYKVILINTISGHIYFDKIAREHMQQHYTKIPLISFFPRLLL